MPCPRRGLGRTVFRSFATQTFRRSAILHRALQHGEEQLGTREGRRSTAPAWLRSLRLAPDQHRAATTAAASQIRWRAETQLGLGRNPCLSDSLERARGDASGGSAHGTLPETLAALHCDAKLIIIFKKRKKKLLKVRKPHNEGW